MSGRRYREISLTVVCLVYLTAVAAAQQIVVTPKNVSGVYELGQTVEWRVEVKGAVPTTQASYVLKKGGLTVMKQGTLDLAAGPAVLQATLEEPGTVLAEIRTKVGEKDLSVAAGAVVAPEKIKPSAPPPEDFDAFWKSKLEELSAVPANAKLEAGESGKASVDYFKVQMDNIRGTHIYGQLAKPKKDGKFPALLVVQWAGVYGLPKANVVNRAEAGWLALNIMAHDLPSDETEDFYKKAAATTLKDYTGIGSDDRDKSYFLRMYLACYRAADYLAQREDWDGKTLVVMGTSQGGQQAFITAAIYPKITAMMANVPGGCDVTGPAVGRAAGFPYWADQAKWKKNDKIVETGRYYDVVNFAPRIKCPALVSMGLIDVTCPPAGVLAACNQLQGQQRGAGAGELGSPWEWECAGGVFQAVGGMAEISGGRGGRAQGQRVTKIQKVTHGDAIHESWRVGGGAVRGYSGGGPIGAGK